VTPLSLGLAFALAAPAPKVTPPGPEGAWEIVRNAVEVFNPPNPATWVFADGKLTIDYPGPPAERQEFTYKLVPGKPGAIDLTVRAADAEVYPGIFEVRGDTLRIAFNIESPHRPEDFRADPNNTSVTLKRVREK
jgi:uncharacterized protein (TIGR03067 family)